MSAPQWDWRMTYQWAGGYEVTYPVGYNAGVHLQIGASYPPGYRIANGQKGGGYPPSGATAPANSPIKLQPNPSGDGRIKFYSSGQITVLNPEASRQGSFAFGLGVCDVNGPNYPMWPYIGCGHYLDINQVPPDTLAPGESRTVCLARFDMVDNAFMGAPGNPNSIPTWPVWEMKPNDKNLLWPAVTPLFKNLGPVPLRIIGFWGIAFSTL